MYPILCPFSTVQFAPARPIVDQLALWLELAMLELSCWVHTWFYLERVFKGLCCSIVLLLFVLIDGLTKLIECDSLATRFVLLLAANLFNILDVETLA